MTLVTRSLVSLLCAFALAGCGDAVTNPDLEGFESDPRVIQGDWVTLHRQADGEVLRLPGELIPAAGKMIGSFEFHRFGSFWRIQFNDGDWDGKRVRFSTTTTINGITTNVDWAATFFPAEAGQPARLLLSSPPFGGSEAPIEYLRPRDVEGS